MAQNIKREGTIRVQVKALAAAVSSGSITRQNGIIGIPLNDAAIGATCAFVVNGVVALTNTTGATIAAGTKIYWDTSAGLISIGGASGDYFIGVVETGGASGALFDLLMDTNQRPTTVSNP